MIALTYYHILDIYAAKPTYIQYTQQLIDPDVNLSDSVSDFVTKNELSYNASPTRSNDMTLHNEEEAFYVPTIEATLNSIDVESYMKLMQIVNSKGFYVRYFDQELGEDVIRCVYATDQTIEQLYIGYRKGTALRVESMLNVKLKFVSRYGYPYTQANDANFTQANKYHMYQLHNRKWLPNFLPDGAEEPDYV